MIDQYPSYTLTQPQSAPKPRASAEPLVASDWWDETCQYIQWETVRYSLFAEAARALGLKVKPHKDGTITVWASAPDLFLVVAYSHRHPGKERLELLNSQRAEMSPAKPAPQTQPAPTKPYTFNAPIPDFDDGWSNILVEDK